MGSLPDSDARASEFGSSRTGATTVALDALELHFGLIAEYSLLEAGRLFPLAQLHELYPTVPAEQNAASLYQQAFAGLVECEDVPIYGNVEFADPAAPLSGSTRRAIEDCLRRHAEPLALIREAATQGECQDLSAGERLGQLQNLESELQANKAQVAGHILDVNILSGMFLPSTFKFAERMVRREAMLLLLRAGVAKPQWIRTSRAARSAQNIPCKEQPLGTASYGNWTRRVP